MADPRPPLPLRFAVVGAGAVARDYVRALADVPEIRLVAAVDVDERARASAADAWQVPVFASVREMVAAAERPHAALVATPPTAHEEAALQLLAAGIHVLCEKPLAPSVSVATRMLAAAARNDSVLMMASKFRYVPDVVEAQTMVKSGLLGEVVLFENSFCSPIDMTRRWNADAKVSGGGVLIDNGAHAVDIARFFLGPLIRVFAHFARRVQAVAVEDSVTLQLEASGGSTAVIQLSWSIDVANDWFITVCGSRGTLQVGWSGSRYRLHGQREWTAFGTGYDKVAAFARQLRDFAWAVAQPGHEPAVRLEDALDSVRVIEAAYRAARVERWIPVQGYGGDFT
ncbi:MAG TPA: Gfo/Idh/MocA family oxidoreductase [Planctomycetota bacterium]|nr:Gfo/Idh/MocA family oxidoreductase [Planctomycetota bacterium]